MRTGAIDERRGIPVYKTNPSIPQPGEISRQKRNRIGTDHKGLVIDGSGEILGNGVAYAYEWEEVDDERFVKLFLAGLKQATGLSKPGLAVFELVYNELRNTPKQDTVQLSVLTAGLKKTTFYDGLRDLLKREFLFRSPYEGTFFINIRYLFNGDRLAFVKGYARNGDKPIDGKPARLSPPES